MVRQMREPDVGNWVQELREIARARQAPALHYANITRARRVAVCRHLASKPLRAFCLASHKSNLREYVNPRMGGFGQREYYNWCTRLLLERLTDWAAQWHKQQNIEPSPIDVIFAKRGGHDYDRLMAYIDRLRIQVEHGTLVLKGRGLAPPYLDRRFWRVEPAESLPGLQLADVVASAFYQGANASSPAWDVAPATELKPIMAKDRDGVAANVGLSAWPLPHHAPMPLESRRLFEEFGYAFG